MKYDFMISFYDAISETLRPYLNHFDVMKIPPKCESDQNFFSLIQAQYWKVLKVLKLGMIIKFAKNLNHSL